MKSKKIRLLVAIGIVCAFLLIVTGIDILVVILSNKIEFDLNYVLIPILVAWAIWSVYGIINKIRIIKKIATSEYNYNNGGITMTDAQFLEKFYDLIGEYCYNNEQYEDIHDGNNIEYIHGDVGTQRIYSEGFCITIEIERYKKHDTGNCGKNGK